MSDDKALLAVVVPDDGEPGLYYFRLTHSSPSGCLMSWEVVGGRERYQIDLERDEVGRLHWHCTCASATYSQTRCKHLASLQELIGAIVGRRI